MYKKDYIIALTENDKYEYIVAIFDNINDFANYLGLSYGTAKTRLLRCFNRKESMYHKAYKIEFIKENNYENIL